MSNEFADSPRTAAVEPGTSSTAREGAATTDRLALLVVTGDACRTHVLPAAGVVTIGRAADNDVAIDESSVSRHHVQLRLDRPMQITDLETANGTWLRDVRLPPQVPTPISFNEAIRLGHTTVVVQRWASAARSRELRRHEYFTARLDEECARAERRRSSFLIAHLAVTSAGSKVDALLLRTSRETDVLASYGPGEYHLLLVEASAVEAQAAVRRFETATQAAGVSCQIGLATYPTDGRDASSLIARARARAIGAGEAEVERAPGRSVVVDPHMRTLYALAERVATADISVLLLGETGVGKEIFAEFLHARSPRRDAPFLRLNCAALTETLLESELFGHEKGAFTGATHAKVGLLESAAGGVVFLDEVGELQPSTQVKLLRVLDERRLTPVGGVQSRPIDVRVVSATNRDLDAEIRRGLFRSSSR